MTGIDESIIAAIDARLAAVAKQYTAMGAVSRITGDTDAEVVFDGSTMAVPVKMSGSVWPVEGDRVVMLKVEGVGVSRRPWWVITDVMVRRWPAHTGTSVPQSTGTTTSGAYSDVPVATSVTFTKRWDATRVFVAITGAGFSTVTSTQAIFGANFSSATQSPIATYDITWIFWNASLDHLKTTDWRFVTGLIADTYTVKVQWLRSFGTGVVSVDNFDRFDINVMEISPT